MTTAAHRSSTARRQSGKSSAMRGSLTTQRFLVSRFPTIVAARRRYAAERRRQPRDVVREVPVELPSLLEGQLSRSVRVRTRPVSVAEADLLELGWSPVRSRADVSQGAVVDTASIVADIVMEHDEQL